MDNSRISIIMGIYNCADTLPEAIESILAQTFHHWKLIMCDDGSKDDTYTIAESYKRKYPNKIVLLKNDCNMGLNYTLNRCLKEADTEYVARMDGDDLCDPMRLQKEYEFLETHQEFAIVSCPMIMFDELGDWGQTSVIERPEINDFCTHTPFFCHAASMIRRSAIESVGGYTVDPKFLRVEDCNLWFKLYAKGYRGANLVEPLYKMRDDRNATHRRSLMARINGCYVLYDGFRMLKMPLLAYRYVVRNVVSETIKCCIPSGIYDYIHKKKYRR